MQHSKLAARFYRCPTAGKYLVAAAQAMPNANVTVQHAYAMHVYARQCNAGGWHYFMASGQPNVAAWQTIRLATLQQYVPYINTCPVVTMHCVARWHLHQYNVAARKAIYQYQWDAAVQQHGVNNAWQHQRTMSVPVALKQRLLVSRADRQRYMAAWCGLNAGNVGAAQYVVLPYMPVQLQVV